MTQTAYGDISRVGAAYVVAKALAHAEPIIILQRLGLVVPMPKNKSNKIHWRRPIPFPVANQLVEGVTPSARQMQYDRVETTLSEYGDIVQITNQMEELATEPDGNQALADISMLLGEQAAETMEMLTYGVVKGGTSVFYDTNAHTLRSQVNSVITIGRQQAITRFLKAQRAKKLTNILSGSVNIGTSPIEASYIAVGHTDLEADIRAMTDFVPVSKYGSMKPVSDYEIGAVRDVRYILSPLLVPFADAGGATSTMLSTSGTNADVYPVIYFTKDCFGIVPLAGKESIVPTVLAAGKPSKSDPIGQRGYAGWRSYFAATILNQLWMARLEVAVTKL